MFITKNYKGFHDGLSLYNEAKENINLESCLLSIYRAPDEVTREIKNKKIRIKDPRLHIASEISPKLLINSLRFYRNNTEQTIISKILLSCPHTPTYTAQQIRLANKDQIQIHAVLYLIYIIHRETRIYSFSNEAAELFGEIYNFNNSLMVQLQVKDEYLRQD